MDDLEVILLSASEEDNSKPNVPQFMIKSITRRNTFARMGSLYFFLLEGILTGAFSVSLSYIQDDLKFSNSELGFAALFAYVGTVLGTPTVAFFLRNYGVQRSALFSGVLYSSLLPMLGIANSFASLSGAMFFYGMLWGMEDVCANTSAVMTEIVAGRALLGSYHGSYSLAAAGASFAAGVITASGTSVLVMFICFSVTCVILTVVCSSALYNFAQEKQIANYNSHVIAMTASGRPRTGHGGDLELDIDTTRTGSQADTGDFDTSSKVGQDCYYYHRVVAPPAAAAAAADDDDDDDDDDDSPSAGTLLPEQKKISIEDSSNENSYSGKNQESHYCNNNDGGDEDERATLLASYSYAAVNEVNMDMGINTSNSSSQHAPYRNSTSIITGEKIGILAGGGDNCSSGSRSRSSNEDALAPPQRSHHKNVLAYLCALGFVAEFGESSLVTWSIIYYDKVLHADSFTKSVGFSCFMVAMATGRFCCDYLRRVYGRKLIVYVSGVLAVGGLFLMYAVAELPSKLQAIVLSSVGLTLAGLGLSTLLPITFSSAGHLTATSTTSTSSYSSAGETTTTTTTTTTTAETGSSNSNSSKPTNEQLHGGTAVATAAAFSYMASIVSSPLVGVVADWSGSLRMGIFVVGAVMLSIVPIGLGIPPENSYLHK